MRFDQFSPQAFERLTQALCAHVLGPGTLIFGAGPDGAREATFDGEVPFPSAKKRWNGYVVMQAKCREGLKQDHRDADWVCEQLKADLDKFLDPARNLRKPQYYLLATNVTLSPKEKGGGKAKVEKVFAGYKARLGLRAWHVWSADELTALLDAAADIRRSYTAWLTPHDVLAALIDSLQRPQLSRLVPLALARDLRNERDVRLRDAGQETDRPIFLEDVFVDLPLAEAGAQERPAKAPPPRVVASLLTRAADRLDPESVTAGFAQGNQSPRSPLRNRIVLLGGPGQGKSTLGQYVSQLARARLLSSQEATKISQETSDLIQPILDSARREELMVIGPARWPVRVDLPGFADALKAAEDTQQTLTLIRHIATRLSRDIDSAATPDDVRKWLGTCPTMIVLDGLDEVPPTSNRREVIRAIESLWDDIAHVNADALVIVTTRPQGYNHDFDPHYWNHWDLAPLGQDDTQRYASRLADVRLSDPETRSAILQELDRAAKDPATQALLTSPLQVAILFGIAYLKESIPQDRWDLFQRYYTLLRDRETLKPGSIVRRYQRQIDAIHYQAGFALHVAAETAGNTNAFLTPPRFRDMVVDILQRDEFEESEVAQIADDLVRVATERLVLLSARVQGRIAFDVRSLQEFMAAAQITSAPLVLLPERLRAIGVSAHWRHVFRIAASKVFSLAELEHHRQDILDICHALDNGDLGDENRMVRAGARLALDLLGDGVANSAPGFLKHLTRRALAALDVGVDSLTDRLAEHFSPTTRDAFAQELRARLQQVTTVPAAAATRCATLLLRSNRSWAEALLRENLPSAPMSVVRLLAHGDLAALTPELNARLVQAQLAADVNETAEIQLPRFAFTLFNEPRVRDARRFLRLADSVDPWSSAPVSFMFAAIDGNRNVRARIEPISPHGWQFGTNDFLAPMVDEGFPDPPNLHRSWVSVSAVHSFRMSPSAATLARALRLMSRAGELHAITSRIRMPWVLGTLMAEARDGADLERLALETESGEFGDVDDWSAAEDRWQTHGLTAADFVTWSGGRYLTREVGRVGAPYLDDVSISSVVRLRRYLRDRKGSRQHSSQDTSAALLEVAKSLPTAQGLHLVEVILVGTTTESDDFVQRLQQYVHASLGNARDCHRQRIAAAILRSQSARVRHAFADELDWLGRTQLSSTRFRSRISITELVDIFNANPRRRGLLPLLANYESLLDLDSRIGDLNQSAFEPQPGDEVSVRIATASLCMLAGRFDLTGPRSLADLLGSRESSGLGFPLGSLLRWDKVANSPASRELLIQLAGKATESGHRDLDDVIEALANSQDAQPTKFGSDAELGRLKLPTFRLGPQ